MMNCEKANGKQGDPIVFEMQNKHFEESTLLRDVSCVRTVLVFLQRVMMHDAFLVKTASIPKLIGPCQIVLKQHVCSRISVLQFHF